MTQLDRELERRVWEFEQWLESAASLEWWWVGFCLVVATLVAAGVLGRVLESYRNPPRRRVTFGGFLAMTGNAVLWLALGALLFWSVGLWPAS